MKRILLVIMVFALGAGYVKANTTIFYDDFNTENGGVANNGTLNYNSFTNWSVSGGTVDLIGNGYYDFLPGNGLYVDMDGSSGNAGIMTTNLNLNAGIYLLSFDLAGNQRNANSEQVDVKVGALFSNSYSLSQNVPFTTFTGFFNVVTPGIYSLSFEGIGSDNIGMLLDNVSVSVIPAPGAILLGSLGAGLVGWLRRRKSI